MKYTLQGFSQAKAIELGLDDRDLMILRWFIDYKDTGKMVKRIIKDDMYYWIKYEGIVEAFPIISWKKDTVYRRLKAMAKKGVLKHETVKEAGVWSYYAVGENYIALTDTDGEIVIGKKSEGSDLNPMESEKNPMESEKNPNQTDLNPEQNILPSYSSNNNSSNNNICALAEKIWKLYPVKKGKNEAIKKIPKILKEISEEELIRCINRYKSEFKDGVYTYMKHGSTFFNGYYINYLDENYEEIAEDKKSANFENNYWE